MSGFFEELQRQKIYRLAVAYIVDAGFVILPWTEHRGDPLVRLSVVVRERSHDHSLVPARSTFPAVPTENPRFAESWLLSTVQLGVMDSPAAEP
jgi:hypothetical protein